jgi:NAD(P)-dependent dehydrogenase (short-subunit alcohol dehydrogenase family)
VGCVILVKGGPWQSPTLPGLLSIIKAKNLNKMNFNNQNILITGGSRGIGRATAQRFAELGGNVIINYRKNDEAARNCLQQMPDGKHTMMQADISKAEQVRKMLEKVLNEYDRIDVLINNAGIYKEEPIEDVNFDQWLNQWKATIGTNLTGLANVSYWVARDMMDKRKGRIINVSSRGAFRGEPDHPAYGASKAAVNSFTQSMAQKLGEFNIAVTAVAPGFVATDMAKPILESEKGDEIRNQSPFGRVAKVEEVAETIVFLASEKTEFLSGGIVDVNGASYLRM